MMPFNTKRLSSLSLLLGLALAGCAGSNEPGTAAYLLPASSAEQRHDARLTVLVAPVALAAFLEGDGIVMQLDDIEVHQARNHLWAEALPEQLRRLLLDRLSASLPQAQVIARGQPSAGNMPAREVRLQLDRFQGRFDGMALIQGHWQLLNGRGELLEQRAFRLETPLTADGYPALVRALAGGWEQLADQLAASLVASLAS
ncbi:ABC-type transport auxiliary lipoprotein family protein [Oceanimonas pelagia]|uniref:ABC-type transport auxiliary lipoprotein family protein n=1 Tax=Oceanimonas pelagia TaxID=3028314 RepID=A0AA50QDE8_9GAMM|nr:ABC-type transport auxiliary lipoprotein family protein [Oceanimonas pelagia]WMC12114.1 ABC-type transport auxiliary lipoprotein family protein [Oceanimonas pelagia]